MSSFTRAVLEASYCSRDTMKPDHAQSPQTNVHVLFTCYDVKSTCMCCSCAVHAL